VHATRAGPTSEGHAHLVPAERRAAAAGGRTHCGQDVTCRGGVRLISVRHPVTAGRRVGRVRQEQGTWHETSRRRATRVQERPHARSFLPHVPGKELEVLGCELRVTREVSSPMTLS